VPEGPLLPTLLLQRLARCSLGIPNTCVSPVGVVTEMVFPAATGLPNAFDIGVDTGCARDTRSLRMRVSLFFTLTIWSMEANFIQLVGGGSAAPSQ